MAPKPSPVRPLVRGKDAGPTAPPGRLRIVAEPYGSSWTYGPSGILGVLFLVARLLFFTVRMHRRGHGRWADVLEASLTQGGDPWRTMVESQERRRANRVDTPARQIPS